MTCEPFLDVDYSDCDDTKFISHRIMTARKEHKCTECGDVINIGDKYEYCFMVFDVFNRETFKTCPDCLSIIETLFIDRPPYGVLFDELQNNITQGDETTIAEINKCRSKMTKKAQVATRQLLLKCK
jgi:hypothetical protein